MQYYCEKVISYLYCLWKFLDDNECPEKVFRFELGINLLLLLYDIYLFIYLFYNRTYNKYLIALAVLDTFPAEFCHIYKDKYIDLDMQDDLQRTDVINWCRTTKPVHALRTTGLISFYLLKNCLREE